MAAPWQPRRTCLICSCVAGSASAALTRLTTKVHSAQPMSSFTACACGQARAAKSELGACAHEANTVTSSVDKKKVSYGRSSSPLPCAHTIHWQSWFPIRPDCRLLAPRRVLPCSCVAALPACWRRHPRLRTGRQAWRTRAATQSAQAPASRRWQSACVAQRGRHAILWVGESQH